MSENHRWYINNNYFKIIVRKPLYNKILIYSVINNMSVKIWIVTVNVVRSLNYSILKFVTWIHASVNMKWVREICAPIICVNILNGVGIIMFLKSKYIWTIFVSFCKRNICRSHADTVGKTYNSCYFERIYNVGNIIFSLNF